MAKIEVQPVSTRRQRKVFLELPWKLYRDDPLWVPPLRLSQKELVNFKRHPFYDDADIGTFIAYRDGEASGRVAAIENHAHNRTHPDDQCGFIGFFESVNDQHVANALFAAAKAWHAERGQHRLRGPVNPSLNYECGLLVENFDLPPTFMMTYNPEFYPALFEGFGFKKVQDLISFVGHRDGIEKIEDKILFVAQEAADRLKLSLRTIDKKNFERDVTAFLQIYNSSLTAVWGHVDMSPAEVRHMSAGLKHLLVPDLTVMAEVDGQPVGCVLGLLDYNPIIKEIDGRLFPLGFLKLLRKRQGLKRVRMMSTNVLPEYQMWGVGVVLNHHLIPAAIEWGIDYGEYSWVLESNHLSKKTLERGGFGVEKVHRIYDYDAA